MMLAEFEIKLDSTTNTLYQNHQINRFVLKIVRLITINIT